MRDAFGGAFILRIMIVFFVIFITFMVVAFDFARTFRVKNGVINILTRNHGTENIDVKITSYLEDVNYSVNGDNSTKIKKHCSSVQSSNFSVLKKGTDLKKNGLYNGVCITAFGSKNAYHYYVTSYMQFKAPLFNFEFIIPISGETKTFNEIFD